MCVEDGSRLAHATVVHLLFNGQMTVAVGVEKNLYSHVPQFVLSRKLEKVVLLNCVVGAGGHLFLLTSRPFSYVSLIIYPY